MSRDHRTRLYTKVLSGDRSAFNALHVELAPELTRFVTRLIGDAAEADDVVQTSFLALYRHRESVAAPSSVRAYLYGIARNLCYDRLRRAGRFEWVGFDSTVDEYASERSALPDETAHWLGVLERVERAFDDMPELHRQALLLYAEAGLRYAEIAEAMDTDVSTVKSRIFQARRMLRLRLGPEVLAAMGFTKGV